MQIDAYLARIGLKGPLPVTARTLAMVHRAQAYAIPYEGLDVQAGVPLDLQTGRIFDKLVTAKRGGWCYETNGLLAWALGQLGFDVMRCTAGVYRREKGDTALGNHLTLLVNLGGSDFATHQADPDDPRAGNLNNPMQNIARPPAADLQPPHPGTLWLCDLGLGDALRAPIPLREGVHHDGPLTFRLERLLDGHWRFHNHSYGAPTTFDFRSVPADETLLQRQNMALQTDPGSYFVLNAEAIRMAADHSVTLLGRVLRHSDALAVRKEVLASPEAFAAALQDHFGITGVDVAALWPKIVSRHAQLFGDGAQPV